MVESLEELIVCYALTMMSSVMRLEEAETTISRYEDTIPCKCTVRLYEVVRHTKAS